MSLFNKDYQNRSGLKCNIVYTDYINDIPIGNYLSGGGGDNITCLTLSGLIVTSNKIYCNYINDILFSSIITTQLNTQNFSYNSNNNFTTINGPFNTNSPIYCTNNIYCNDIHPNNIWTNTINGTSLNNIDKLQYLDVNSSLATTQYNVQSFGYNEFNNTLYILNDTKFNITADLITTSINGILTNKYVAQSLDGFTTVNYMRSNNIIIDNNTDGLYWANGNSQIYDNLYLNIISDNTMIFRIGTTWTNVIQLNNTFIYNTLNVSDNIKLINTNGLTFQTNTGSTLMSINNSGNLNVTGSITSGYTIPLNNNSSTVATTQWVQSEGFSHLDTAETITGVKTFTTNPIILNQYSNGVGTIRTGTPITITAPYQEYYPLAPTATQTITLPVASATLLGVRIRLRRVGGTITVAINSASANIYPNTSFTASNVLLPANSLNVVITCLYLTSTTYGWFVA